MASAPPVIQTLNASPAPMAPAPPPRVALSPGTPIASQVPDFAAVVAGVRSKYAAAVKKVGEPGLFSSSTTIAAAGNLKTLGGNVEKWATTYLAWARAGHRDDGSAYSWAQWADFGTRDLLSAIAVYVDCAAEGSQLRAIGLATLATVKDTAELVEKTAKVGLGLAPYAIGLGLLVVGALYVLPLVRGAKAALPSAA